MKKIRLFTTLLTSAFALCAITGCTQQEQQEIESYIPAPEVVQHEGVNIKSITFENVPKEIKIGYFDHYEIYLKIVYSDDSIENYPLTMSNFPEALKTTFNTVGSHTVTIAFRGQEITSTFNVVEGKAFYLIRYFSHDGHVLAQEKVAPGDKPTINPPEAPQITDPMYKYEFLDWDKTIDKTTQLTQDIDVHPKYQKTQKRYHASKAVVPTSNTEHLQLISANYSGAYYYTYSAYIYLGRIDRVPLLYSDYQSTSGGDLDSSVSYHDTTKEAEASALADEIFAKSLTIDTSHFSDYFADTITGTDPLSEAKNTGTSDDFNNASVMFEGDTSYCSLYANSLESFVSSHCEEHPFTYHMKAASDLAEGNAYYRAAIETSVDVVMKAVITTTTDKPKFTSFEYYFLLNSSNTFPVAEYSNETGFISTGNKLTYSMEELSTLLNKVVEDHDNE